MSDYILIHSEDVYHWGILGQRWGVRRYQNEDGSRTEAGKQRYRSTGIRAAIARRNNAKVDKGFQKWKEGSENKKAAIDKGKDYVTKRIAYENDPTNKELKSQYKQSKKEYKKALSKNTTYRKGSVKDEVYHDLARKYLSEAKKVNKQLKSDPSNKELQKKYNNLMSEHDVARAKARRAQSVASKRSNKKASIKRGLTITAKTLAGAAVITGGVAAANKWLLKDDNKITKEKVYNVLGYAKKAKNFMGYF